MKKLILLFVLMVLPIVASAQDNPISFNITNGTAQNYTAFAHCNTLTTAGFDNEFINSEGQFLTPRYWPNDQDAVLSFLVFSSVLEDQQTSYDTDNTYIRLDWNPTVKPDISYARASSSLNSSDNGVVNLELTPLDKGFIKIVAIYVKSVNETNHNLFISDAAIYSPSKCDIIFRSDLSEDPAYGSSASDVNKVNLGTDIPNGLKYDNNLELQSQTGGITTTSVNILNKPLYILTNAEKKIEFTIQSITNSVNSSGVGTSSLITNTLPITLNPNPLFFQQGLSYKLEVKIYGGSQITVSILEAEDDPGAVDGISTPSRQVQSSSTKYYTIDGRQTNNAQRGLNIVRTSDGSVKKILK